MLSPCQLKNGQELTWLEQSPACFMTVAFIDRVPFILPVKGFRISRSKRELLKIRKIVHQVQHHDRENAILNLDGVSVRKHVCLPDPSVIVCLES